MRAYRCFVVKFVRRIITTACDENPQRTYCQFKMLGPSCKCVFSKRVALPSLAISSVCLFAMCLYQYIQPVPFPGLLISYPMLTDVPMIIHDDGSYPNCVTVVTAFINIGSYIKGLANINVTKDTYVHWMAPFEYLTNPLVVYTDTPQVMEWFLAKRSQNNTKVVKVKKKNVWPFEHIDTIAKIYSNPDYPKHTPNTVYPPYPCSQHAKYGYMEQAISRNYFHTNYFAWVDLGYFRGLVERKREFRIAIPPNYNKSQVAFNMINDTSLDRSVEYIFKENIVRYGGGFFIGSKNSLKLFIRHYKFSFHRFLRRNLSNTDQQVLYSMYTDSERRTFPPPVDIQEYISVYGQGDWFYLGYLCLRERQWPFWAALWAGTEKPISVMNCTL